MTSSEPPVDYFSNVSRQGPVRFNPLLGSIGVLESPDYAMPIGSPSEH